MATSLAAAQVRVNQGRRSPPAWMSPSKRSTYLHQWLQKQDRPTTGSNQRSRSPPEGRDVGYPATSEESRRGSLPTALLTIGDNMQSGDAGSSPLATAQAAAMMGMLAGLARPEEEARRGAEASSSAEELTMQGITTFGVHTESTTFTVVLGFAILTILYCCKLSLGNSQMFQSCKSSRPILPQYYVQSIPTLQPANPPAQPYVHRA